MCTPRVSRVICPDGEWEDEAEAECGEQQVEPVLVLEGEGHLLQHGERVAVAVLHPRAVSPGRTLIRASFVPPPVTGSRRLSSDTHSATEQSGEWMKQFWLEISKLPWWWSDWTYLSGGRFLAH